MMPVGRLTRLLTLGAGPNEGANARLQRQVVVLGGVLMSVGGLCWGSLSVAFGLLTPAAIPFGYTLLTAVNLWWFSRSRHFPRARVVQVFLSLALPFLFQWSLGGFLNSGGVMLWAMIALVGSLTFSSARESAAWLILYCALTALSGLTDAWAGELAPFHPTAPTVRLFFVVNIISISAIVFTLAIRLNERQTRAIDALEAGQATNLELAEQLQAAANVLEEQVKVRTSELEAALVRAEEGTRAKGEFLAVMSHEIRTPLNGILGTTELLELSKLNPEQRDLSRLIRRSGELLLSIINDVLDFSKIEAGRIDLSPRAFHLRSELDGVVGLHRSLTGPVKLTTKVSDEVPERIVTDPDRLVQVIGNLLSNAVKFTHEGTITVEVGCRALGPGKALEVRVRDTGIGISAENLGRLFKPFTQADSSTTRRYGGTGLGLAICARLVERLGGTLGVTSTPGVGTTFHFTVPFEAATEPELVHGNAADLSTGRPVRVLLAEDNIVNQAIAKRLLVSVGCEVVVAEDGRRAVEEARLRPFDLILMDVQMPELDGLEAARQIRELPHIRQPRIVAVTANAFETDRSACLAAGMDDFIAKPLRLVSLRHQLEQLLPHGTPLPAALTG